MASSHKLAGTEREDVDGLLKWVAGFKGVEAFPVYDYIQKPTPEGEPDAYEPGSIHGVTIQWDVTDVLVEGREVVVRLPEEDEEAPAEVVIEPVVVHPEAGGALFVPFWAMASVIREDGSGGFHRMPSLATVTSDGKKFTVEVPE